MDSEKMTSKITRPTSPRFRSNLTSTKTLLDSLVRLNPVSLLANPVMFIVELTSVIVTAMAIYPPVFYPVANSGMRIYYVEVALILLITVWFSTLADALAETQAKNTASSLRSLESEVQSKKILTEGDVRRIVATPSTALRKGDLILLEKNDVVPIDAEVLEGIGMVDESLLTGESTPVRKAPGDEVIGGSKVISDTLTARVTVNPEDTYISEMIRLVESSKRPRTPNEVAVTIVLIGLTAIFTIIVVALLGLSITLKLAADLSVLIALYVCLLPTTIGALLPSIGLSGISRLYRRKIVAKSGRAVERAGDTDVIILDKTGTITVGNRQAVEFIPFEGHTEKEMGEAAFLSSWHDDTPEGRSLIRLAYEDGFVPRELNSLGVSEVYEFSASTRTSGVKISQGTGFMLPKGDKSGRERGRLRRKFEAHQEAGSVIAEDETEIIKGAPDAIKKIARSIPSNFDALIDRISSQGDTPLALTRNREAIGIIRLKDVLKPGIKEKILSVKVMGIRPVMLTGDQPLTAKSIANEVGIDEYKPEAKPEDKYDIVMKEQSETRVVAMIGDGTNDAPALAVADVGLAMNSGTQAAKEAANMVDLESNPAKIIEVVLLGKQLLMTRGAVTTFSIANDVAKYFAIVPVMFAATLPELKSLNILGLGLNTAVLSALIFNA
ncbi:MAG TPA: HAD-IC family P-type ATPase, partial [Dongiaceae bacterium]|nr:HAD-IC family P-type ATPase [Dongiaceae bacterium]